MSEASAVSRGFCKPESPTAPKVATVAFFLIGAALAVLTAYNYLPPYGYYIAGGALLLSLVSCAVGYCRGRGESNSAEAVNAALKGWKPGSFPVWLSITATDGQEHFGAYEGIKGEGSTLSFFKDKTYEVNKIPFSQIREWRIVPYFGRSVAAKLKADPIIQKQLFVISDDGFLRGWGAYTVSFKDLNMIVDIRVGAKSEGIIRITTNCADAFDVQENPKD